ncbi:MAG: beta-lactamase family protein [Chloroflexi bacterium]|nr:beta-lactamase family protein [Chloroflexota bacterium]
MAEQGLLLDEARDAGLHPDRLRRAFTLLDEWVTAGVVPGAAVLVARGGRVAGEAYLGLADPARQRPATSDTIWGLASVTKPFTATAVLLLVERGCLALDEALGRLLPEFLDAPATAFDRRAVTLRHVLSHCSGLPGFSADNLALRQAHRPLEDFVRSFGRQPVLFVPGAAHYYSNPGILLAAECVGRALAGTLKERVETPAVGCYHGFVQEAVLAPLGMVDSALRPPPAWDDRIARVLDTGQEGQDYEMTNSAYYRSLGIPWGGLFSTPRDLARFVDLFLPAAGGRQRLGVSPGAAVPRLLAAATVREMTSIQAEPPDAPPDLAPELRDGVPPDVVRPRVAWGLGWEVKGAKRGSRSGDLTSAATYGHGGATGTMVWADPHLDLTCVLLTNRALRSKAWAARPYMTLFSNAVAAAAD